jgi:hypothetical protein
MVPVIQVCKAVYLVGSKQVRCPSYKSAMLLIQSTASGQSQQLGMARVMQVRKALLI